MTEEHLRDLLTSYGQCYHNTHFVHATPLTTQQGDFSDTYKLHLAKLEELEDAIVTEIMAATIISLFRILVKPPGTPGANTSA